MFTMTATKSSTCPVSGLAIEPGDTITRTGSKYTPWSLTKSEIDRKQRVARSMPTPAPEPSGICPLCLNDVYPGDAYCGYCGVNLTDGYLDETHDERTARPTTVTDAYTIATDDEQPVILAEVRHIDATPKHTTPEPIAPQNAPESRTAVLLAASMTKAIRQLTGTTAAKSDEPVTISASCPNMVTVTASPDGAIVSRRLFAQVSRSFTVTMSRKDARNMADTLATAGKDTATISPTGNALTVTIAGSSSVFSAMPTDAPEHSPAGDEIVTISAQVLARHIAKVAPAADKGKNARPSLQCLALDTSTGSLVLVASDGFRLAHSDTDHATVSGPVFPISAALAAKWAAVHKSAKSYVMATISATDDAVTITTDADDVEHWQFTREAVTFPKWQQIVPRNVPSVSVSTYQLRQAVTGCAAFASDANDCIAFTWDADTFAFRLTATAAERGTCTRYVDVTSPTPMLTNGHTVALNARYVLDAIKSAGASTEIALQAANQPAIINGMVVMPMSIEAATPAAHKHAA